MQSLKDNSESWDLTSPDETGRVSDIGLLETIDKILDKGLVINGDVSIAVAGAELLSLKLNLVIASLETAKRYGIELPWEKWDENSGAEPLQSAQNATLSEPSWLTSGGQLSNNQYSPYRRDAALNKEPRDRAPRIQTQVRSKKRRSPRTKLHTPSRKFGGK